LSWTLFGPAVTAAATITPTGNLFHVTGETSITSVSGVGIASGTEITLVFDGVLKVTNGSNLRLASNFTTAATNTLTLNWDGNNWYEKGRSTGAGTFATVGTGTASNTDVVGELTASSNTVTYKFTGRYISHPVCIASNETTAGRDIKVTYTGATSVIFTTPGPSDVLGYACFKRD
jgi:hypothetical protein